MQIEIIVSYTCTLDEEDVERIESGEIGVNDIDAWYYVSEYSSGSIENISEL